MPEDDSMLGQNEVDVRNEARREYNRGRDYGPYDPAGLTGLLLNEDPQQIALCTNDERCQAAADEHDPGCPVEQQLVDEFNF